MKKKKNESCLYMSEKRLAELKYLYLNKCFHLFEKKNFHHVIWFLTDFHILLNGASCKVLLHSIKDFFDKMVLCIKVF